MSFLIYFRSKKLRIFYDRQMFNSHACSIQSHESILTAQFIIEKFSHYEADTDPLDNIEPCEVISIGVCRSVLSVSTLKNWSNYFSWCFDLSNLCSVTMTWVWCASQNVKINTCYAYQPAVLLTAWWNVIALRLHVAIVSIFMSTPWMRIDS